MVEGGRPVGQRTAEHVGAGSSQHRLAVLVEGRREAAAAEAAVPLLTVAGRHRLILQQRRRLAGAQLSPADGGGVKRSPSAALSAAIMDNYGARMKSVAKLTNVAFGSL